MCNKKILILDEPAAGLDPIVTGELYDLIAKINREQKLTVIMVSHDIEFCSMYAHRCSLFFDGSIVTTNDPRKFFSGNGFYTTVANRMSRHVFENAITCDDVISLCKANCNQVESINENKLEVL